MGRLPGAFRRIEGERGGSGRIEKAKKPHINRLRPFTVTELEGNPGLMKKIQADTGASTENLVNDLVNRGHIYVDSTGTYHIRYGR